MKAVLWWWLELTLTVVFIAGPALLLKWAFA